MSLHGDLDIMTFGTETKPASMQCGAVKKAMQIRKKTQRPHVEW